MIRLFCVGVSILIWAILANGFAQSIGLKTWYDFIEILIQKRQTLSAISLLDWLWLMLIYPLVLGASAWAGEWIYKQIIAI